MRRRTVLPPSAARRPRQTLSVRPSEPSEKQAVRVASIVTAPGDAGQSEPAPRRHWYKLYQCPIGRR